MAGLLKLVAERPMRVTEIAKQEGLAQPTVTALINTASHRSWVSRSRDVLDGRVVLVNITPKGERARQKLHSEIVELLHERTRNMPREELDALALAADALLPLIEELQRG